MKKVIPSGITFLSLLFGAAALWQFIYGEISTGFYCTFASIILDVLDGYAARKLDACTRFGRVFDLVVDFIVFGPILVAVLFRIYGFDTVVIAVALFYTICHIRRLYPVIRWKKNLNTGLPDDLIGIIVPICYYFGLNLLYVFAACAILMITPIQLPRMSETLTKAKAR